MPAFTASDGYPLEVRCLGIFELDPLVPPTPEPITYKMKLLGGDEVEVEFDLATVKEVPPEPDGDVAGLIEGTKPWRAYRRWQTYNLAVSRLNGQYEAADNFLEDVLYYLLEHCLVNSEDINRIVTEEDWRNFYWAALVPPLTEALIAQVLRVTYKAKFDDKDLFDVMFKRDEKEEAGGKTRYDLLRYWENVLANKLGLTDAQYALVPVEERARRVVADNLRDWQASLEIEFDRKRRGQLG